MNNSFRNNLNTFFGFATLETLFTLIYLISQKSSDENVIFLNYSTNKIILITFTLLLLIFFLSQTKRHNQVSNISRYLIDNISKNPTLKIILEHMWFIFICTTIFLMFVNQITTDIFISSILSKLLPLLILFLVFLLQSYIIFSPRSELTLKLSYSFLRQNYPIILVLGSIIIIGILIRALYLFQPIRFDEAVTLLSFASRSLWHAMSTYSAPNNHVFHSLLVNISLTIFDNISIVALRLPSFIFGILIIPTTFVTASRLFDQKTALLSTVLVSSSSYLIEYSTLGRGYSLICLLTLLLILITINISVTRPIRWYIFSLLSAIGLYTIPIMLFPLGSIALWMIYSEWPDNFPIIVQKKFAIRVGFTMFSIAWLTTILYMPIIINSGLDSLVGISVIQPLPWERFINKLLRSVPSGGELFLRDLPNSVKFSLYIGFIYSVSSIWKNKRKILLPFSLLFWCSLIIFSRRIIPFSRVLLFILPIFFIYASHGIIRFTRYFDSNNSKIPQLIFLGINLLLSVWLSSNVVSSNSILNSKETGTLREAEQIVLYLDPKLEISDVLLAQFPSNAPLEYYLQYYQIAVPVSLSWEKLSPNTARVYLVVNKENGQTLSSITNIFDIPKSYHGEINVIKSFEYADLYELYIR